MVRGFLIKAFALLLLLQTVSPFCRAVGAEWLQADNAVVSVANSVAVVTGDGGASGFTLYDKTVVEPLEAHEACWFEGAHLFNAPAGGSSPLPLPVLMVLGFTAVILLNVYVHRGRSQHWSLPYRSPPSQPLLQVFRI